MYTSGVDNYESFPHHVTDFDGLEVHYVDAGSGDTPVVLVHGSPISSFAFREQITSLAEHRRVVAPDLLGFGRSEAPKEGAPFDLQARALRGLLDELELDRYSLVGHDWGGPIAMGAAAKRPAQLDRLVLMNTTIRSDFKPPPYWRPMVAGGLGRIVVVELNLFGKGLPLLLDAARDEEIRLEYSRAFVSKGTRRTVLALEQLRGYRPLMEEVERALPEMQVPTMIFWGHPDVYFRRPELHLLRSRFEECLVREVDGAGHFPMEDAPEAVTRALLEFLG